MEPFLKWPGGKRWLVPTLRQLIENHTYRRYYEPFLGGGAVLFGLGIRPAVVGDINDELMNVYRQVATCPEALEAALKDIPVDAETYQHMRAGLPTHPVQRAVRFLYLNRTAFAGMYRLNRRGLFNVPFGGGQRTPEPLWRDHLLIAAAPHLRDVEFLTGDFEQTLSTAGDGDLVYCDPTYTVTHNNNGFIRYNERNFSWADQVRLAQCCTALAARGVTALVSNAASKDVLSLYPEAEVHVIQRQSRLSPRREARGSTTEYLFRLDACSIPDRGTHAVHLPSPRPH